MGRHLPPDHSKGDERTIGGYRAVHERPAAFEGADGMSYSVEIETDETGDAAAPVGAYLLFVRWGRGDPVPTGHLETDFLARGTDPEQVSATVGALSLDAVKQLLDERIQRDAPAIMPATERAAVLRGTGGTWAVHTERGDVREVSLRGRLKHPAHDAPKLAVGDEVIIERDARGGAWAIAEVLPRRSRLARRAPGGAHGERIVAANVDQVVVVFAAARPEPHPRMLDRFLVIAAANDIPARIVINKLDLVSETHARERFAVYARAGYPVHYASVPRHEGLAELRDALAGRTSALTGPSGAGKSSLLNAMYPGLDLRVGEISHSVNKGRHTTVGAAMHPLAGGGYVMDTPGLREVGVWNLDAAALDRCFLELLPHLEACRFRDCAHGAEPGCAVREAVARGDISVARYESYRKLREELSGAAGR